MGTNRRHSSNKVSNASSSSRGLRGRQEATSADEVFPATWESSRASRVTRTPVVALGPYDIASAARPQTAHQASPGILSKPGKTRQRPSARPPPRFWVDSPVTMVVRPVSVSPPSPRRAPSKDARELQVYHHTEIRTNPTSTELRQRHFANAPLDPLRLPVTAPSEECWQDSMATSDSVEVSDVPSSDPRLRQSAHLPSRPGSNSILATRPSSTRSSQTRPLVPADQQIVQPTPTALSPNQAHFIRLPQQGDRLPSSHRDSRGEQPSQASSDASLRTASGHGRRLSGARYESSRGQSSTSAHRRFEPLTRRSTAVGADGRDLPSCSVRDGKSMLTSASCNRPTGDSGSSRNRAKQPTTERTSPSIRRLGGSNHATKSSMRGTGSPTTGERIFSRDTAAEMSQTTSFVSLQALPPCSRKILANGASFQCDFRKMRIGIETEFLIRASNRDFHTLTMERLIEVLAQNHNGCMELLGSEHPRMQDSLRVQHEPGNYNEWCLAEDPTVQTTREPWGLEMVSPIFEIDRCSPWRQHVAATWGFLAKHYYITSDATCATHVHVSLRYPTYNARDIRKIAAASIYFEQALEALVPNQRRLNSFCRSNYVNGPAGARVGRSRLALIAEIEKQHNFGQIVPLLQPAYDKHFSWNFLSHSEHGTIEFRKAGPSVTGEETLSWAEYVTTFVQASLMYLPGVYNVEKRLSISTELARYAPNVGGLRKFMQCGYVAGVSEPWRLDRIWRGHCEDEAVEPVLVRGPRMRGEPLVLDSEPSTDWSQKVQSPVGQEAAKERWRI